MTETNYYLIRALTSHLSAKHKELREGIKSGKSIEELETIHQDIQKTHKNIQLLKQREEQPLTWSR